MEIKPIKTEQDYLEALRIVEPYFDKADNLTEKENDFLEVMITLIESYENKHYIIALPNPIEVTKFRIKK